MSEPKEIPSCEAWLRKEAEDYPNGPAAEILHSAFETLGRIIAEELPFGTDKQRREKLAEIRQAQKAHFSPSGKNATVDPKELTATGRLALVHGEPAHLLPRRNRK